MHCKQHAVFRNLHAACNLYVKVYDNLYIGSILYNTCSCWNGYLSVSIGLMLSIQRSVMFIHAPNREMKNMQHACNMHLKKIPYTSSSDLKLKTGSIGLKAEFGGHRQLFGNSNEGHRI